ncbi:MAG: family peptidase [Flavipsychrobacter sp.]|nr:family peptidase [Flavipsychrobacter sp.]
MILTVNTPANIYLNIRTGKPSTESPTFMSLKGGAKVDVVDVVIGLPIEGSDIWYKCKDGNFYWSGGFDAPPQGFTAQNYIEKKIEFLADKTQKDLHCNSADENKWKVSWGHVDMEIWKIWRDHKTKGDGVKVAVIDDGVHFQNNDLLGNIKGSASFINNILDDNDPFHGTMSAGLVAANCQNTKTVYGVAPGCDLFVYRAASVGYSIDRVCASIQKAVADGAKIISMSFFIPDDPTLKSWIEFCNDNGIIMIAAAGDINTGTKMYPASYDQCLSIGGYYLSNEKTRLINKAQSNSNDSLTLLGPSKDVLTTSPTSAVAYHQATSCACAFMAGLIALIVSKAPSTNYSKLIETLNLNTATESIEKNTLRSNDEGYGIISPLKFLTQLNIPKIK